MKKLLLLILIAIALIGTISVKEIKQSNKQINELLSTLTPETEWMRPRLQVLVDSFKVDKVLAIEILSTVWEASRLFDHNPDKILGLIEQESSFRPSALSHMGAMGLMQVMPLWWRRYNPHADPFSVRENIRMGCFVLWIYRNMSDSDKEALSRYFAGSRWEKFTSFGVEVLEKYEKWKNL